MTVDAGNGYGGPMHTLAALLLLAGGCQSPATPVDTAGVDTADTDAGTDTDTDPATGRAALALGGVATVHAAQGTYDGMTTAWVEVVEPTGDYEVGDVLCAMEFPAEEAPESLPELACPGCTFAVAVAHGARISRGGPLCDTWWPESHPGTEGSFWDLALGHHPDWEGGGPALVIHEPAHTDSEGTYHPEAWRAPADAEVSLDGQDFTWAWPYAEQPFSAE